MPPNAGALVSSCPKMASPASSSGLSPSSGLRRSQPAFGHCALFAAATSAAASFEQMDRKGSSQMTAVCPAPVCQVELEFSLAPSSSSSSSSSSTPNSARSLQVHVQSPSGASCLLSLSADQPTASFCARHSRQCGHGQWRLRLNGGQEQVLELDGVGSLHFWAHSETARLELRERQFLRVPGAAFCPLAGSK